MNINEKCWIEAAQERGEPGRAMAEDVLKTIDEHVIVTGIKLEIRPWWRRLLYSPGLFVRMYRITHSVRLAFNLVRVGLRMR